MGTHTAAHVCRRRPGPRPLNDDQLARRDYQLSARQLRNIRNAAVSGALTRRAAELGVVLPPGFTEHPSYPTNGRHIDERPAELSVSD